jgi:FtsZ-binding cell division protein ZapB
MLFLSSTFQKRKLQVEKARIADEQRENEERLIVTEQKMTAAVQLSIQKIKFLQVKLFESKQECDKVSLELVDAKQTIECLRELNKTKVK